MNCIRQHAHSCAADSDMILYCFVISGMCKSHMSCSCHHLGIRVCPEVSVEEAALAVQQHLQLISVGDVAVVNEVHAQGAVHKEGLCFLH